MVDDLGRAAKRVQQGNTAAFQEIVDGTSAQLVRLAARMLGSVADAEDVVQDAYVKAYRALVDGSFDGRSAVGTWHASSPHRASGWRQAVVKRWMPSSAPRQCCVVAWVMQVRWMPWGPRKWKRAGMRQRQVPQP